MELSLKHMKLLCCLSFSLIFFPISYAAKVESASPPPPPASPSLLDAPKDGDYSKLVPLDSMPVEAVESYRNPHKNQFSFSLGYYPLSPYYTGYTPSVAYTYFFKRSFAWDIVDLSYVFAVDKGLTSELADKYGVEPRSINRLKFVALTQAAYFFSYGKTVFSSSFIRYFRTAVLLGGGFLGQSNSNNLGISYGLRVEVYTTNSFSFKGELKNISTLTKGFDNYGSISLGTTLSF